MGSAVLIGLILLQFGQNDGLVGVQYPDLIRIVQAGYFFVVS